MKFRIREIFTRYWLLFFLAMLYGFVFYFQLSFEIIWHNILLLDLWQLIILLIIYFLFSFFMILNRKFLLFMLGYRCHFGNLFLIHFSSMAAHYTTPAKIGFPTAVFLLNQVEKIPYSKGIVIIFIELTVSILLSGIFALFGSLLFFNIFSFSILKNILLILFIIFITIYFLFFFRNKFTKWHFFITILNTLKELNLSKLLLYVALASFIQVFGVINLFLLTCFYSDGITFPQAIAVSSTAFFLGAVSMIPMGLGVREATVLFFLTRLGIPNIAGLSIITIQRLLSTGLTFFLGMLFGFLLGVKNIMKNNSPKIVSSEER